MRPVLRWTAGAVVVVLGAGVAGVALAADDGAGHYRLATATDGDVTSTVAAGGTVDVVHRSDVSFGTSGTVSSLSVREGQTVRAGQRLGALDTAALQTAVDQAESDLADAKATLASDQQSQADAVDEADQSDQSGQTDQPAPSGQPDQSGRSGATPSGGASAALAKQQQAVRTAQTAATKAMAAAKAALSAQAKVCAAADQGTTQPDTPEPDTSKEDTPKEDTPGQETPGQDQDTSAAETAAQQANARCSNALAVAGAAQDKVARAQDTLQRAIGALAGALQAAISQQSSQPQSTQPQSTQPQSTQPQQSTPDASDDAPRGADATPTAASIASDQAAIDTAEADLLSAEQSLDRATLTAPIAGTVASVTAAAGDAVSAGSAVVVLIGAGAMTVETTVPVERIAEIKVGQDATVTASGARNGVAGKVTRIGKLADDAADAVAYPVTVTVEEPGDALPAGGTAGVDIVVGNVRGVLTVPTSAVHGHDRATVTVLSGDQTASRDVTVGTVGPLRTEITDGLAAGERVVLADLDEPLPSTDSQQQGPGGLVVREGPRGGPQVRQGR